MLGVSRFRNKVAVIAGAEHPIGAAMAARLAGFGATVIALGRDETKLRALATPNPKQIEPLALHAGWRDILPLLQEAWADQHIDIYVDIMPLMQVDTSLDASDGFAFSAGLAASLRRGLRAGKALSVLVVPGSNPLDTARPAPDSYRALLQRFTKNNTMVRMVGVRMPRGKESWTRSEALSAGDTILMLCHPVSRGVKGGTVIDWDACVG